MEKSVYEAPEVRILRIKTEGLICQSGGAGVQDYYWHNYSEE